jgi:hypothetical protein
MIYRLSTSRARYHAVGVSSRCLSHGKERLSYRRPLSATSSFPSLLKKKTEAVAAYIFVLLEKTVEESFLLAL